MNSQTQAGHVCACPQEPVPLGGSPLKRPRDAAEEASAHQTVPIGTEGAVTADKEGWSDEEVDDQDDAAADHQEANAQAPPHQHQRRLSSGQSGHVYGLRQVHSCCFPYKSASCMTYASACGPERSTQLVMQSELTCKTAKQEQMLHSVLLLGSKMLSATDQG